MVVASLVVKECPKDCKGTNNPDRLNGSGNPQTMKAASAPLTRGRARRGLRTETRAGILYRDPGLLRSYLPNILRHQERSESFSFRPGTAGLCERFSRSLHFLKQAAPLLRG
jgi:hypothetical protein